jgi:[NiFe] hydrogenase diaphorase moiety small subunit
MSDKTITFTIDEVEVKARPGQTIMEAADEAAIYIPRLCSLKGLSPFGACRVCTVLVNGRPQSSCTQPAAPGIVVENASERLHDIRQDIVEMLFVEGNHFCMFCEKSGNCELQAMGYRLGMMEPKYPRLWPRRELDASHPDIFIDRDRCILCARCIRASREQDGKHILGFLGRGPHKRVTPDSSDGLVQTDAAVADAAVAACPVGSLMRKRVGFGIPIGQRKYDHRPIGSDIESGAEVPDERK